MNIPTFKVHSSAIIDIMGGVGKPTDKQMAELDRLSKKDKLTELQEQTLKDLIAKRDAKPNLQAGAKTVCEKWLREQVGLYNRRQDFSNKYTDKGERCEAEGIRMTARIMGYGEVFKNEIQYENDFIIGTPDLPLAKIIEDIKCSWNEQTFPLFENELPEKRYWWQGQGYMDLLPGIDRFAVCYCLINTPMHLIERAAKYKALEEGFDYDIPTEIWDMVEAKMTYPADMPDWLRYKRFEFKKDNTAIQAIHEQVKLCRAYIAELVERVEVFKTMYKIETAA